MQRATDEKNNITRAWQYYEEGRNYNHRLSPDQYALVDTNIEFFAGNQWLHLPQSAAMASLPKPTFNIIKRVGNMQVASIMSSGLSIHLEPLSYYDGSSETNPDSNACAFAQAEIDNLVDKLKLGYRGRDALFDGIQTGDYCAHFYFDPTALPYGGRLGPTVRGEIKMELVDGINVMFGNPNNRDAQSQPYILIIGRDTVDSLNAEAKRHAKGNAYVPEVTADSDWNYQTAVGGKTEINTTLGHGKATYIYLYTKVTKRVLMTDRNGDVVMEPVLDRNGNPVYEKDEDGKPVLDSYGMPIAKLQKKYDEVTTVHVSKSTRTVEIFQDIDTGLSFYPIAWGNWERQKNQYHGRALVTGIIQNQIFVNSMFALVMRHMQLQAFPKRAYNADLISQFSNEIGVDIAVHNMPPTLNMSQVVTTLQGMDMSNQIMYVIDKAIEYTKDCLGSTDASLGSSTLDNTSALMVLDNNSKTPLENPRACFNEWLEDIAAILLDMMGTYYGKRPIIRDRSFEEPVIDNATQMPMLGQYDGQMRTQQVTRRVIEEFDFSELKHLFFMSKIDAGAGNTYSQAAQMQTLDNMRKDGLIEFVDYLERIPDSVVPRRLELIQKLKNAAANTSGVPAGAALPTENAPQASGDIHAVMQQMNPAKAAEGRKAGDPSPTVDDVLNSLPTNVREQFDNLPSRAKGEVAKMAADKINK